MTDSDNYPEFEICDESFDDEIWRVQGLEDGDDASFTLTHIPTGLSYWANGQTGTVIRDDFDIDEDEIIEELERDEA